MNKVKISKKKVKTRKVINQKGVICLWSGNTRDLPEGWSLVREASETFAKQAGNTMDMLTREILMSGGFGYGADEKLTKWQKIILRFKLKVIDIRVSIAEWIGGEYLHRYCDY